MRDDRQREHKQEQWKIFAILGAGIVLTGNAFLEARGGGPLTGPLLRPIHSIMALATSPISRTERPVEQAQRTGE